MGFNCQWFFHGIWLEEGYRAKDMAYVFIVRKLYPVIADSTRLYKIEPADGIYLNLSVYREDKLFTAP
jgi:hypothetical protein